MQISRRWVLKLIWSAASKLQTKWSSVMMLNDFTKLDPREGKRKIINLCGELNRQTPKQLRFPAKLQAVGALAAVAWFFFSSLHTSELFNTIYFLSSKKRERETLFILFCFISVLLNCKMNLWPKLNNYRTFQKSRSGFSNPRLIPLLEGLPAS